MRPLEFVKYYEMFCRNLGFYVTQDVYGNHALQVLDEPEDRVFERQLAELRRSAQEIVDGPPRCPLCYCSELEFGEPGLVAHNRTYDTVAKCRRCGAQLRAVYDLTKIEEDD